MKIVFVSDFTLLLNWDLLWVIQFLNNGRLFPPEMTTLGGLGGASNFFQIASDKPIWFLATYFLSTVRMYAYLVPMYCNS